MINYGCPMKLAKTMMCALKTKAIVNFKLSVYKRPDILSTNLCGFISWDPALAGLN